MKNTFESAFFYKIGRRQAALDVFEEEPPLPDNPLINRPDVVCTPHLGASTVEAQEDVAVEIADAVIDALKGELAATAVNAPMVPAEILAELQPYVTLAEVKPCDLPTIYVNPV